MFHSPTKWKIIKGTEDLNNILGQLYLTSTYRMLHLTAEFTFFSGTFSRIDHRFRTSLNKFKHTEIISKYLSQQQ
jgi:hypothetical protein